MTSENTRSSFSVAASRRDAVCVSAAEDKTPRHAVGTTQCPALAVSGEELCACSQEPINPASSTIVLPGPTNSFAPDFPGFALPDSRMVFKVLR